MMSFMDDPGEGKNTLYVCKRMCCILVLGIQGPIINYVEGGGYKMGPILFAHPPPFPQDRVKLLAPPSFLVWLKLREGGASFTPTKKKEGGGAVQDLAML